MAYYADYPGLFGGGEDEDENGPYAGAQAYSGGGGGLTSAGGSAGSAPAPSASPGGGVPGSKFVNFDRLMSANKDAAAKTSADMVGKVGAAAQAAEQGQVDYAKKYGNAVTAGGGVPQSGGFGETPVYTPYSGPKDPYAPEYGADQVTKDTLAAQQQVNALGSMEGYRALFDQQGGGGSSGAKDFSAALSYGGAQPGARDLAARYGDLTKRLTGTFTDARTQSDAAQRTPTPAATPSTAAGPSQAQILADENTAQGPALGADGRYYDRNTGQPIIPRADQMDDVHSTTDAPVTANDAGEGTRAIGQDKRAMYELGGRYYDWIRAGQPDLDTWKAQQGIA